MNVIVATPPFEGHLGPLLRLMHSLYLTQEAAHVHLIVCGWASECGAPDAIGPPPAEAPATPPPMSVEHKAGFDAPNTQKAPVPAATATTESAATAATTEAAAATAATEAAAAAADAVVYLERFPWLASCVVLHAPPLRECNAARFNLERAQHLSVAFTRAALAIADREVYGVDWLVYDSFAIEAAAFSRRHVFVDAKTMCCPPPPLSDHAASSPPAPGRSTPPPPPPPLPHDAPERCGASLEGPAAETWPVCDRCRAALPSTRVACVVAAYMPPESLVSSGAFAWPEGAEGHRCRAALKALDLERDTVLQPASDAFVLRFTNPEDATRLWRYAPHELYDSAGADGTPPPATATGRAAAAAAAATYSRFYTVPDLLGLASEATESLDLPDVLASAAGIGLAAGARWSRKPGDTVLVSLGTVVVGNLWKQNAAVRPAVARVLARAVSAAQRFPQVTRVVVALPTADEATFDDIRESAERLVEGHGRSKAERARVHPLECHEASPETPAIVWRRHVDQAALLATGRCLLLVTHGGCASAREAALLGVRTLVVPFFGDQHAVARRTEALGWGRAALDDVVGRDPHWEGCQALPPLRRGSWTGPTVLDTGDTVTTGAVGQNATAQGAHHYETAVAQAISGGRPFETRTLLRRGSGPDMATAVAAVAPGGEDERDPRRRLWARAAVDDSDRFVELMRSALALPLPRATPSFGLARDRAATWRVWGDFVRDEWRLGASLAHWRPWSLLYGTNADRHSFAHAHADARPFGVGELGFGGAPARLVDHWHDALIAHAATAPSSPSVGSALSALEQTRAAAADTVAKAAANAGPPPPPLAPWLRAYAEWVRPLAVPPRALLARNHEGSLETLWGLCVRALDYWIARAPPLARLHFVVGRGFVSGRNRATTLELEHLVRNWPRFAGRVAFYVQRTDVAPSPQPAPSAGDRDPGHPVPPQAVAAHELFYVQRVDVASSPQPAPLSGGREPGRHVPPQAATAAHERWVAARTVWRRCGDSAEVAALCLPQYWLTHDSALLDARLSRFADIHNGAASLPRFEAWVRARLDGADSVGPAADDWFSVHSRVKTGTSIREKLTVRRLPADDVFASRVSVRSSRDVARAVRALVPEPWRTTAHTSSPRAPFGSNTAPAPPPPPPPSDIFRLIGARCSERGRVWHLQFAPVHTEAAPASVATADAFRASGIRYELQVWTSLQCAAFGAEHKTIYKAGTVTPAAAHRSECIRSFQHALQDVIDSVVDENDRDDPDTL